MRCLDATALARASTGGESPPHVDECLACRRALADEVALRELLQRTQTPRLDRAHRSALKAETMAAVGQVAPPVRWHRPVAVVALVAAAAAATLVVSRPVSPETIAIDVALEAETVATSVRFVAREPAPPPAVIAAKPHELAASRHHGVAVVVGSSGAIDRSAISRDELWQADNEVFHTAWRALRDGRNREAIALFDRAEDPAVAEEASYWAAVAARRDGDCDEARRRFAAFLAQFPSSALAERARAALGEL